MATMLRIAAGEVRVGDRVRTPAHGFWREVIEVTREPSNHFPDRELAVISYAPYHSGMYDADGHEMVWSAVTDRPYTDSIIQVRRAEAVTAC